MPRVVFSIVSQILILSTVFMIGRWDYSFAWIFPFMLSSARDYFNRKREVERAINKIASNLDDQAVIRAKYGELPAWAIFPDVERADWVNVALKLLWPSINQRVEAELRELEPKINKHIPFKSFSFNRIDFGQVTPRITGVKVYERMPNPNELMVDVYFSYYGDAELSVSINKIEGGIKDISFEGVIRLVLKLIPIKSTFVGSIEISFLESPTFDFNLTTALAPIDMFSTGDLLRSFIADQISYRMIFPKKVLIKIKDRKERMKEKEAKNAKEAKRGAIQGVIRAEIKALSDLDGLNGETVRLFLELGDQIAESPEAAVKGEKADINITSELIRFSDDESSFAVSISVLDGNSFHRTVDISTINVDGRIDERLTLCPSGSLDLSLSWFELSTEKEDLIQEPTQRNALLIVYIDSTRHLPKKHPDVYVKVDAAQQSQETISQGPNSSYKKYFNIFLENPANETLTVTLVDEDTSNDIGSINVKLSDLISRSRMKHKLQAFPLLHSNCDGEIMMSMKLRALKPFSKVDSH